MCICKSSRKSTENICLNNVPFFSRSVKLSATTAFSLLLPQTLKSIFKNLGHDAHRLKFLYKIAPAEMCIF